MTTKLGINTYEQPKPNIIYQDQFLSFAGGTLRSGIGKVYVGQLLSKASDGYLDKWIAPTVVSTPEVVAVGDGVSTFIWLEFDHINLKPGSVVVTAVSTPGGNGLSEKFKAVLAKHKQKTVDGKASALPEPITMILYDIGNGTLHGEYGSGVIDYITGEAHVEFELPPDDSGSMVEGKVLAAGDITAIYSWFNTGHAGTIRPIGILSADEDATDAATKCSYYKTGHFWGKKLTPDISADTYTKDELTKIGIYTV